MQVKIKFGFKLLIFVTTISLNVKKRNGKTGTIASQTEARIAQG
jgi:hypothetical protein